MVLCLFPIRLSILGCILIGSLVAGNICKHFDDTNIYPDPVNCSRFIRCQGKTQLHMDCPSGLVFNPATLSCDYIENIRIPNGYCEYKDLIYEKYHFCNCNKYVLCSYGVPYEKKCPTMRLRIENQLKNDACGRSDCEKSTY